MKKVKFTLLKSTWALFAQGLSFGPQTKTPCRDEKSSQFNFYHLAEGLVPEWMNERKTISVEASVIFLSYKSLSLAYSPNDTICITRRSGLLQDKAIMPKCWPHHLYCDQKSPSLLFPHTHEVIAHSGGVVPMTPRKNFQPWVSHLAPWNRPEVSVEGLVIHSYHI